MGLLWWLRESGKESACNAGERGSIPELGRSPGEGNGSHSSVQPGEVYGQSSLED